MQSVDTYSEEWRHECEARFVASLPTKAARARYFDGDPLAQPPKKPLAALRGQAAVDKLRADAQRIYQAQRRGAVAPATPQRGGGAAPRAQAGSSPAAVNHTQNTSPSTGSFPRPLAEGPFRRGGCVVSEGGAR